MFGQSGFESSQLSACECVATAQVRNHYAQLLDGFYTRHAPERHKEVMASSKIAGVLEKAAEVSPKLTQLRKLFLSLHDKYDAAIKFIEQRPKMQPPRLAKSGHEHDAEL